MNDSNYRKPRVVAGRYEIRKSLGRGGFSEVWLAYDRQLDREVALKQLFGSVEDEAFRKQREREIRIHSQLSSKHVVSLHDGFEHDGHLYLVLELMDRSLAPCSEAIGLEKATSYIRECLLGLQDLHDSGVIHRDLKPANIFLDRNGHIRLGDFGVAQVGASVSLAAWSPKYIAPELALGDPANVMPASDLYSLGLVLYQFLLGDNGMRKAFPDVYATGVQAEGINNRWLLWHNNLESVAPDLNSIDPDIPSEFSSWALRLVAKDPSKRFQSAKETMAAMPGGNGVSSESAIHSGGISADGETDKHSGKKAPSPWLKAAFALAFVAILSAGAYLLWHQNAPPISTLALKPPGIAELAIFWNGTEIEPDSADCYLLTEPLAPGHLTIQKDTFLVLDSMLTIAAGDSIKLRLSEYLAHIDNLIQASKLSTVTFKLNTQGEVVIDGVGERRGDSVSFVLPVGSHPYSVTAAGFLAKQDTVNLLVPGDLTIKVDLSKTVVLRLYKVTFWINTEALVKINGVGKRTGKLATFDLPAGKYAYSVVAPEYSEQHGVVVLGEERDKEIEIRLEMKNAAVNSNPSKKPLTAQRIPDSPENTHKAITFERTLGGSGSDAAYDFAPTIDGGYVLAGATDSKGAGGRDAWLIKTDKLGNVQWDRTYGGSDYERARSVALTLDGGYMVLGNMVEVGTQYPHDPWLLKTDNRGNVEWNRSFGGSIRDQLLSVILAPDGDFILVGIKMSKRTGKTDAWLIRLDKLGKMQWERTFGGASSWDAGKSVALTPDGGYVVAGHTESKGAGDRDAWLIRTDSMGILQWDRTYGGEESDGAYSVALTPDGGFVLAGDTKSQNGGSSSNTDAWLIKTDSLGIMQWDRTYGGVSLETAWGVDVTPEGEYVVAATTYSKGAGNKDAWLFKTDWLGNVIWDRTYGGPDEDFAISVVPTPESGYVFVGWTSSKGAGSGDAWIVKTDSLGRVAQ